jgi:tetratricopeptide (TPR) repeat protein
MRKIKGIGWMGVAALGLLGGCQGFSSRPKEHASATLLDSGPQPRLSSKQAADVHVSLGRSCEAQGRFDEARAAYLEALKRDPKRADAEVRLAILDDRKGDEADADRHFARALKLRPKDPEILCDQGYSLYLRRRWADAETSLKQALAVDHNHVRSHANLALVLARQGDSPGALAEFARAGCDPSDARSNLGLVLALEGRFEESKREYALALTAKPSSSRAKEGLQAATVALNGRLDPRTIAANGQAAPPIDPALVRTSAEPSGR